MNKDNYLGGEFGFLYGMDHVDQTDTQIFVKKKEMMS